MKINIEQKLYDWEGEEIEAPAPIKKWHQVARKFQKAMKKLEDSGKPGKLSPQEIDRFVNDSLTGEIVHLDVKRAIAYCLRAVPSDEQGIMEHKDSIFQKILHPDAEGNIHLSTDEANTCKSIMVEAKGVIDEEARARVIAILADNKKEDKKKDVAE
jgi:hypothetical protein